MLKGYRSHIINTLTALVAILALPQVSGLLPEGSEPFVAAFQGIVAIIMRQLTTTPVGVSGTAP